MKKLYLILLAAIGMTMTSCLMEEKELFDQTPAERMEAYLEGYRTLLAESEGGWVLQYYPEENQSYGGYAYILQFTKDSVTAYCELAVDPSVSVSSLYKMTPDDGPVITFDTYNDYIHFFATPDIQNYEAYHGDYEFRIVGKNSDETEIYLRGKRTNNKYTLVKFNGDPVEYINKTIEFQETIAGAAFNMIADGDTSACSLSGNIFSYEYNVITAEDTTVVSGSMAFCYNPNGLDFYEPIEIKGTEYAGLVYDAENKALTTEDGKVVVSKVVLKIEDLVGKYQFTASSALDGSSVGGTMTLVLSDNPAKGNLMFTEMFSTPCIANVYANLDTDAGTLSVASPQVYGQNSSYLFAFLNMSSSAQPLSTPVVFSAGIGEFGGYNGFIADGAFSHSGSYLGYFEVYSGLKAKRVSK